MNIQILKPHDQGTGEFDGGKIKEQKPIGFPGEGSKISRLGPLFYWAWAHTEGEGGIGLHPHQGFEILTYVLKGKGYHKDSLGTDSVVGEGGVQLMQAGSGISHAEEIREPSELFQIWLEPHLSKAVQRKPVYSKYEHREFPVEAAEGGAEVKTVLGEGSPIRIVADAVMRDVVIPEGAEYKHNLSSGRILAGLAIRGGGSVAGSGQYRFDHKDFVVIHSEQGGQAAFRAEGGGLRLFLIEVPAQVDYPLYNKRK